MYYFHVLIYNQDIKTPSAIAHARAIYETYMRAESISIAVEHVASKLRSVRDLCTSGSEPLTIAYDRGKLRGAIYNAHILRAELIECAEISVPTSEIECIFAPESMPRFQVALYDAGTECEGLAGQTLYVDEVPAPTLEEALRTVYWRSERNYAPVGSIYIEQIDDQHGQIRLDGMLRYTLASVSERTGEAACKTLKS
jgi:hypothetical protein